LHVLSLPPAFVLSQDQTLKLKRLPRSDARASNRQPFLTDEPLHITPNPSQRVRAQTSSVRQCFVILADTETQQTVKLTPTSSGRNPNRPICKQSVHRQIDQTAHISLHQVTKFKERGAEKTTSCAFLRAQQAARVSIFTVGRFVLVRPAAGGGVFKDACRVAQAKNAGGVTDFLQTCVGPRFRPRPNPVAPSFPASARPAAPALQPHRPRAPAARPSPAR
jgi:hypothetical protein